MSITEKSIHLPTSLIAWSLSAVVALLAIAVWANSLGWNFTGLSNYQLFPIFGLIAFSVMWSHYIVSFLNKAFFRDAELSLYYRVTGYVVLIAILLHPGVLAYQRFRDGYGLPLKSLTGYVQPSLSWVVLLGTVSFFTFLAFELHRWFKDKKWWNYLVIANELAMFAIFYHALRLGSNLQGGWYEVVWYFYGLSFAGVLLYKYVLVLQSRSPTR